MDSNDRSDRNEMEQIQRGLEAFLEKNDGKDLTNPYDIKDFDNYGDVIESR